MHDVCASFSRMMLFLSARAKKVSLTEAQIELCRMFGRDIHSIKEHGDALDNKLAFLLDATIGLVTLEQNQIIKIFSGSGRHLHAADADRLGLRHELHQHAGT